MGGGIYPGGEWPGAVAWRHCPALHRTALRPPTQLLAAPASSKDVPQGPSYGIAIAIAIAMVVDPSPNISRKDPRPSERDVLLAGGGKVGGGAISCPWQRREAACSFHRTRTPDPNPSPKEEGRCWSRDDIHRRTNRISFTMWAWKEKRADGRVCGFRRPEVAKPQLPAIKLVVADDSGVSD